MNIYISFLILVFAGRDLSPDAVHIKTDYGVVTLDNKKFKASINAPDSNIEPYKQAVSEVLDVMNDYSKYVWLYKIQIVTPDSTYTIKHKKKASRKKPFYKKSHN